MSILTFFLRLLALVTLVYGTLLLVAWLQQSRLIFLPTADIRQTPADIWLAHEVVHFDTSDSEKLQGWYLPANGDADSVILFFHGNAGNISHRLDTLRILHSLGHAVFIFDYRGYGESSGRPSEAGLHEDARAAWRYLLEDRGYRPDQVILFGRSLGGAVGARLASEVTPAALIIESAFISVAEIATELYPWLPVRWLVRMQFDTRKHVKNVNVPVLVVHSRDDEIIPFRHSQEIYAAASEPKAILELRGSHNEGFLQSGASYINGLDAFMSHVFTDQSGHIQSSIGTATSSTSTSIGKPSRQ